MTLFDIVLSRLVNSCVIASPLTRDSQYPIILIKMTFLPMVYAAATDLQVDLGFKIPTFGELLTFIIRLFFVLGGLVGLFYLLTGALNWITSGGNKENLQKAQERIQNAIIGILLIVVVLSVIWTFENIVFQKKICFGISCPLTIESLIK
jgi:hypothetical protein